MTGYNIIFDSDDKRLGFAKSDCNYEEFAPILKSELGFCELYHYYHNNWRKFLFYLDSEPCVNEIAPVSECTASCNKNESAYISSGVQVWLNPCDSNSI
jgi:hypothetical protein